MPTPALKIRYETKPKRPVWIVDLDDLNRIYREAKAALLQPDSYHLAVLQAAIDIAEEGKG